MGRISLDLKDQHGRILRLPVDVLPSVNSEGGGEGIVCTPTAVSFIISDDGDEDGGEDGGSDTFYDSLKTIVKDELFTKQCAQTGYIGSIHRYSKSYTGYGSSYVSQQEADDLAIAQANTLAAKFFSEGQAYANNIGTCTIADTTLSVKNLVYQVSSSYVEPATLLIDLLPAYPDIKPEITAYGLNGSNLSAYNSSIAKDYYGLIQSTQSTTKSCAVLYVDEACKESTTVTLPISVVEGAKRGSATLTINIVKPTVTPKLMYLNKSLQEISIMGYLNELVRVHREDIALAGWIDLVLEPNALEEAAARIMYYIANYPLNKLTYSGQLTITNATKLPNDYWDLGVQYRYPEFLEYISSVDTSSFGYPYVIGVMPFSGVQPDTNEVIPLGVIRYSAPNLCIHIDSVTPGLVSVN